MLPLGAKACAQDWNSRYLLRISKMWINCLLAFQCKTIQNSYFLFLIVVSVAGFLEEYGYMSLQPFLSHFCCSYILIHILSYTAYDRDSFLVERLLLIRVKNNLPRPLWVSLVAQSVKNLPARQEIVWNALRQGFNTWVGKIPWRREWQPSPVCLPGKSHG